MCNKSTMNCLFLEKNAVDLKIHMLAVVDMIMRGRPHITWTDSDNIVEWTLESNCCQPL